MAEDPTIRPVDGLVWSPNGQYLAFVADLKQDCDPCRRVGYVRPDNVSSLRYIEPPEGREVGLPRWSQDGRLLVAIYANNDPAGGATYVYDVSTGRQVVAEPTVCCPTFCIRIGTMSWLCCTKWPGCTSSSARGLGV